MPLKRPVTLAQARRWPAAAKRRESFCARMGGMRRQLTGEQAAADPGSPINRALAAWDCDKPEGLKREHVSKGIRMARGITPAMVGSAAKKKAGPKKNPVAGLGGVAWEEYDIPGAEGKTYHARYGGVRGTVAKQGGVWRLFLMTDTPARKPLGVWDSKNGLASGAKAWLPIVVEDRSWQGIKAPARKPARTKNPRAGAQKRIVARYARVPMASINWSSMAMGDDRTPLTFVFSETEQAASSYRSYKLPDKVVKNRSFQALANALPENMMTASVEQIRDIARRFMR